MPRLPPIPELDWRTDGTPIARVHDDLYFSADDGLAETRAVFLEGCGLPDAWAGRDRFTIAELGFGTGLNFLAAWQMWVEHRPALDARLHFVSFEGFPLTAGQASRALAKWPELEPIAGKLISRWPDRARGVRRMDWPEDGVSLTLHSDDVSAALPDARFMVDAWLLDGFAPARNKDMWASELYPLIAERSAPGARLATFTVAGSVRRGLEAVGFKAEKRPGFGRKRDRLEAVFSAQADVLPDTYGLRSAEKKSKTIAIIGAGIAGATQARAFMDRGVSVSVFDAADEIASGASGNPLALIMPRLDAGDNVPARLVLDAYLHARAAYRGLPGVTETDVRQFPRDEKVATRFEKLLADPPLGLEDLEAIDGGLLHKGALIVRPRELIEGLLEGVELRLGTQAVIDAPERTVNGERFDAIIHAGGMAAEDIAPWLGMEARLGQIESATGPDRPPDALVAGQYALSEGKARVWGATYETHEGGVLKASKAARAENMTGLEVLNPYWRHDLTEDEITSRVGVRASTYDWLPVAGPLPDHAASLKTFASMKHGRAPSADAPFVPGIYLATGMGSRGFTWGPWLASILAAQMFGEPAPASEAAMKSISPMRFIYRSLKRSA